MPARSVRHASFVIERDYPVPPKTAFAAFADPKIKTRWFTGPDDWERAAYRQDFRVGGSEFSSVGPKGGTQHVFNAIYQDIVPDERIIFTYDMRFDDERISVSLTTIEFTATASGTHLTFTEQGAFLEDYDDPDGREEGTRGLLDKLGKVLAAIGGH